MKRSIAAIAAAVALAVCLCCGCGTGCGCDTTPWIVKTQKTEGLFVYNIIERDGEECAVILGFSEEGKKQETIVVPEYIGGAKVKYFNLPSGMWGGLFGDTSSDKLLRLYFPYEVKAADGCLRGCPNIEKVLLFFEVVQPRFICPDEAVKGPVTSYGRMPCANLTYYADGTIYWIDDYDYGGVIPVLPPEPQKEGMHFAGWYRDEACLDAWDFENDRLPEAVFDEYGQVVYRNTALYAKFEP